MLALQIGACQYRHVRDILANNRDKSASAVAGDWGPKQDGNFVHSLVLTDVATGWTECVALPVRNQSPVVHGLAKAANDLPFSMRGIDTDNDSAFMNQTVFDYCVAQHLELTRSRAY